jgi:hypothetical protein
VIGLRPGNPLLFALLYFVLLPSDLSRIFLSGKRLWVFIVAEVPLDEEVGDDPAEHGQALRVQPVGSGSVEKELATWWKILISVMKDKKKRYLGQCLKIVAHIAGLKASVWLPVQLRGGFLQGFDVSGEVFSEAVFRIDLKIGDEESRILEIPVRNPIPRENAFSGLKKIVAEENPCGYIGLLSIGIENALVAYHVGFCKELQQEAGPFKAAPQFRQPLREVDPGDFFE